MANSARSEADTKEYLDSPEVLDQKVTKLAELIKKSKYVIGFTGAGISTSAGIPDFRSGINTSLDTGAGKWALEAAKKQGINVAKQQKNWSGKKKGGGIKAIPTTTHMTLVKLAEKNILKYLISQNTDGLHRKSGFAIDKLSELHGNGNLEICGTCGKQYLRDYRVRDKKLAMNKRKKIDPKKEPFARQKHWTGRYCSALKCSRRGERRLYDTVVAFGESLPGKILTRAEKNTEKADLCISMGSSLTVTPAADMPDEIAQEQYIKGSKLVIVNLQKTPLHDVSYLNIFGKTDEVSKLLMKKLGIEIPQWNLDRFMCFNILKKKKEINIYGCDRDGTRYDIFKKIVLKIDEDTYSKETKVKTKKSALKMVTFKAVKNINNINFNKKFEICVKFMGHYKEPDLLIDLSKYFNKIKGNSIVLNMKYNPFERKWMVDDFENQCKNIYVEQICENLKIDMSINDANDANADEADASNDADDDDEKKEKE